MGKIKEGLADAADTCYMIAGGLALIPAIPIQKWTHGSGMGAAIGCWALGFLVLLPITGPIYGLGCVLDLASGRDKNKQAEQK